MLQIHLANVSTWQLADLFHEARRAELESRRRSDREQHQRETLEVMQVLLERYQGLIRQVAVRSGLLNNGPADAALKTFGIRCLLKLRDGTYGNALRGSFSTTFWNCLQAQLGADLSMGEAQQARVHDVKQRFMLRQFVDEMDEGPERVLLAVTIYSEPGPTAFESSGEVRRRLPPAYELLHETVLKSRGRISELTDQAIQDSAVVRPTQLVSLYDRWLVST
ncbi:MULTISPECIES: hypothetical protein [unclassified Bradyrhizobium]|uniref:hypothetical protein n=1 Tax=unclassified Bradyrhizobium TaxID=2631580 RepID=UPI001FF7A7A2|nr:MULTISPECIES: hypothetical protein [unclassified Bradyrhizobium]MCK1535820.1 hypothetical protein [Bradyrhizobium sp. 176]MCK1555383.1 hypothetical protein [Bradyrhizobium sp. 171]MCK1688680.1 hypothetical protein [Bradyrhizobium sp. 145]